MIALCECVEGVLKKTVVIANLVLAGCLGVREYVCECEKYMLCCIILVLCRL